MHRKVNPIKARQSVFLRMLLPVLPTPSYTGQVLAEGLGLCLDFAVPKASLRHEVRQTQGKLTVNQNCV